MTDDSLDKAFRTTPEPDANAKKRAINLALIEFEAAQQAQSLEQGAPTEKKSTFFQGFLSWLRPMGNNNPNRNDSMNLPQRKLIISGLATCGLAVFGIAMFNNMPLPSSSSLDLPILSEDQLSRTETPASVDRDQAESTEESIVLYRPEMSAPEQEVVIATELSAAESNVVREKKEIAQLQAQEYSRAKIMQEPSRIAMPATAPAAPLADTFAPQAPAEFRDRFEEFKENSVKAVSEDPVSTFSIDVDTASYSFVRRSLNSGHLPPKDAVRVEELINYFDYNYPLPANKKTPFQPNVSVVDSPWKTGNKLIHIGIKGYQLPAGEIPRSNLVFLLDVSGSMSSPDKLPLVQQSMELLLNNLKPDDTVAIVVYAGAAGTVLEPTKVKEKQKILTAVQQLQAGGSTAGAQGIQLAYQLAEANFDPKAVNRIILATDGDFNVGQTDDGDLKTLVERKRDKGIYLSVLGFGQGNYQDAMMQTLAQNGNGIAAYIDTLSEAQKVLVHEATSTLFPIASDVKIQVEFNPAIVAEYRLIGYETRALNREDFNNDKVDAGDIGAGHTVTAIYEITPVGEGKPLLEPSRYESLAKDDSKADSNKKVSNEYAFLRIRYKLPGEKTSQLIEQPIGTSQLMSLDKNITPNSLQQEAGFATAVAGFAQLLRGSHFIGEYTYDDVIALAQATKGSDDYGYRTEFIQLVRKAKLAKAL